MKDVTPRFVWEGGLEIVSERATHKSNGRLALISLRNLKIVFHWGVDRVEIVSFARSFPFHEI